jgi:hypothetical protein
MRFATPSTLLAPIALAAAAMPAMAQTTLHVTPQNKFAWSENVGFLNFADADITTGATGVRFQGNFLSGQIWSENIGWISVGNGAGPYLNTTGANSGVNYNTVTKELSGYAWSENAGWINFGGGAMATPPNAARVESSPGGSRLRGYAWGENIGWINLDNANVFVGLTCPADIDGDGQVDLIDFFAFFNCWDVAGPCAEIDGTPTVDLGDFFMFFTSFDVGC